MKKIIVLIVFLLPLYAFAQFNKGDVFLGGSLSLSLQNNTTNTYAYAQLNNLYTQKDNTFSVLPSFGYFVNKKLAIGASLGYSYSLIKENEYGSISTTKYNSFLLGGLIRYYVPISNTIYFAVHGSVMFNRGTETISNSFPATANTEVPNYTIGASVRPYFVFFLSPKWSVEASIASLNYTYNRELPNVDHSNSFELSINSFAFGIAYYFRKKQ